MALLRSAIAAQVAALLVDTSTMQINPLRGADPTMQRMADSLNRADAVESP